jgi:hypothetical protein
MSHTPDSKKLTTCYSCYRSLSEAFFGRSIYRKSGLNSYCLKCHNERSSHINATRTGWTPKVHTPDLIYNVTRHNRAILIESATIDMELVGYGVKDKCLYKINIGAGKSMTRLISIYKGDSLELGIELTLNEVNIETVLKLLKQYYIRLERSELDLLNVKTLIYDLGE